MGLPVKGGNVIIEFVYEGVSEGAVLQLRLQ